MPTVAKQERAEQMLGELAELSLMLARDLAVQAKAAEDVNEKVALTTAFQKMSRTVRLTLALSFKLDRDAARDAPEVAGMAEREAQIVEASEAASRAPARITPVETQKRRVRNLLNRLLWNEAEGDQEDYEVLLEDLDARLYEAQAAPGFADLPIEVLTQTLARDMGLSGELVITTAASLTPANTAQAPLADTG
jgi:hypothetical protein